ncbi:uncharacterized protein LOC130387538 [Gadus chalcogrammus]|uniref:uncharacterized protein LOC130387538 n=1 Tax=Gadus chalcogrammus TaxID=1042646 RepID=UPI0024C4D704|nr:uncharacterized protein LOC130387538 [Gadus chalcogrammus]
MPLTKSSTHFWSDEESRFMLNQVKDLNILKFMDGRKTRNGYLFKRMSTRMAEAGFIRTPEQIRIKWKNIRQAYNNAKQNNSSGQERVSCPFYSILDDLLGKRTLSNSAGQQGLDVGFEAANQVKITEIREEIKTELGEEIEKEMGEEIKTEMEEEIQAEMGEETSTEMRDLEETMGSTTQQREDDSPSTSTESTRRIPPLQKNSELPGTSAQAPGRRMQRHTRDVDVISQHMAEMREFWREQLKESDAWQERLLTTIMDNNTTMVAALLEGIKSLRPPAPLSPRVCQVVVNREEESDEAVDGL